MVCVSCSGHPDYKKNVYVEKNRGARKLARTLQLKKTKSINEKKIGKKCKKKMDLEIKKKIYVGKKIVVLVSWPENSNYKKNKKYISGKKGEIY